MNVPGTGRVRRAFGRLRARITTRAVILLYHRVADDPADPYLLCVAPHRFEQQLQAIREVATPLPLAELARLYRERRAPERAVALTFDDGYQDNLYTARPLLERYDVPATVFVTTGEAGRMREFWWDELQRVFLETAVLPGRLRIAVAGATVDLELGTAARWTRDDARSNARWSLEDETTLSPRHAALRMLHGRLMLMRHREQLEVLDRLLDWAGLTSWVRPTHRALRDDEVARLEDGGLVAVGAHTISHPALDEQPVAVQREEIRGSKATLEQWVGHAVPGFAYPYGSYSEDSVREARAAGYDYACACIGQPVRRGSDRYLLPRLHVADIDGDALARTLKVAFGD